MLEEGVKTNKKELYILLPKKSCLITPSTAPDGTMLIKSNFLFDWIYDKNRSILGSLEANTFVFFSLY